MLDGKADKDLVSKQADEVEEREQNERRARFGRWRHRNLAADITARLKTDQRSGISFPSLSGSLIPCFHHYLLPAQNSNSPIDDLQMIPLSNDAYFVVLIMLLVPKKRKTDEENDEDYRRIRKKIR